MARIQTFFMILAMVAAFGVSSCSQAPAPAGSGVAQPAASAPSTSPGSQGPAAAARKDLWTSQTTGNEYRVRQDADRFTAEWTNMSGAFLAHGAYIRSDCKRQGTKWVGESHSHLPCAASNLPVGQYSNWCDLVTKIEFNEITPTRITGFGEGAKKIDCQKCQILESSWKPFVWVPKK